MPGPELSFEMSHSVYYLFISSGLGSDLAFMARILQKAPCVLAEAAPYRGSWCLFVPSLSCWLTLSLIPGLRLGRLATLGVPFPLCGSYVVCMYVPAFSIHLAFAFLCVLQMLGKPLNGRISHPLSLAC